jgi:hypothetical protein
MTWQNHTDYTYSPSPLRNPQPLHGGRTAFHHPVWLQIDGRPLRVRAVIERWSIHDEFGERGAAGDGWHVELENGEHWYAVHVTAGVSRWIGERIG